MSDHDYDEHPDPMEQPGASLCGHCGLYPIMPGEDHDCPERGAEE